MHVVGASIISIFVLSIFAGFPPAIQFAGISFVTIEFAAIMEEGLKQAKSDESMTVKEAFSGLRAGI